MSELRSASPQRREEASGQKQIPRAKAALGMTGVGGRAAGVSKAWKRPEEQDAGLPDTRRRDPHTTGESPALQRVRKLRFTLSLEMLAQSSLRCSAPARPAGGSLRYP